MSDVQAIADHVEIEALRGEFTDASMMHDWDRFASLFTEGWRFAERAYEIRYIDTTPLTGTAPQPAGVAG